MKDGVLNWCAIGTAVLAWNAGTFTARAGLDDPVIESLEVRRSYAEGGDPSAQYNMGITYMNGQGAPRDLAKAVDWFRKAANQGIPDAQYNLAIFCLNGEGLQKNEAEAVKWLSAAAVQGNFSAQKALIRCYADGIGVPKSPGKALLWDFLARRTLELREEQPAGQPERPPKLRADGAVEWVNADGTRRALHVDGGRETIAKDGTLTIERRNGVKTQVAADGVKVSTYPDGSTERKFPDGKVVTRDAKGTIQTKFPDGRKILEGKATLQDGREVEASQEYDKGGKLIASRISDTDNGRVQVSYSDKTFAFEHPAEDEKGEKVTLIEKYSAEGQLTARELVRADGRKREGQEEWTIKRWMPSPSSPHVKIQVLERYGLGGSVLKQEVLAEAKVEPLTPAKSAAGPTIVRQGNTVVIQTPARYPEGQLTIVPYSPPVEPVRSLEEMSRGDLRAYPVARQDMKTKRSIEKELGELAEIERNCWCYTGATDAEYEQARAAAARFTISMLVPPQKPVAASAVLARGFAALVTPPQQPPLVEIPNDLSSKYPLGMNGSEALKIRPWKHSETPHFVVHYAEASDALTVMRFIETAHFVVTQALSVDERAFKKKSHVFIFPNAAEWNEWLRKKGMPSSVAGYAYKDELLVGAQGEKDDYAKVVCHEAAHAVVARYYAGRKWPLWLSEGFAEYMASKALAVKRSHQAHRYLSTEADRPMDIAQVINRLTYGVPDSTIPVRTITIGGAMPADDPLRRFYPNSERMVWVLQEKLPAAAFPKFVNLLVAGNAFEVSLREAYGKSCSDMTTFKVMVDTAK